MLNQKFLHIEMRAVAGLKLRKEIKGLFVLITSLYAKSMNEEPRNVTALFTWKYGVKLRVDKILFLTTRRVLSESERAGEAPPMRHKFVTVPTVPVEI